MTSHQSWPSRAARSGWSPALILALVGLLVPAALPAQAAGKDKKDDDRGEVILSNLPAKGTSAYKELLRIAGSKAKGQILSLTKSEVWKVPKSLIGRVKAHCEKTGVDIIPVQADWNQILKAPIALSTTNA